MWRTEKYKLILRLNRKANANEYVKSENNRIILQVDSGDYEFLNKNYKIK